MLMLGLYYFFLLATTKGLEFKKFPSTGPPPDPRKGVVMESIPFYNYLIVFGGYESRETVYNDIWNLNATDNSWNEMFATNEKSPGKEYVVARYSGGGFYRYKSKEYCIWGGNSLQGQLNDIWCFHLLYFTWREITTSVDDIIDARYQVGYTSWNETGTTMFAVFGGISMAWSSNSLYILNTDTWIWALQPHQGDAPGAHEDPILTYYSDCLYMIGGIATYSSNPYTSLFYQYNLTTQTWKNITNKDKMFTFRSHAKAALIGSNFFLAFGRKPNSNEELNTVYKVSLDSTDFPWSLAELSVDEEDRIRRDSYGLGVIGHKAYIYGGTRDQVQRSSLAIFDLDTHPIEYKYYKGYDSPGPRMHHSMNLVGGYILLFGGENGSEKLNDLWKLDTTTLIWEFINAGGEIPEARSQHASASSGDILIIWGGNGEQGYLNNAYIYNVITNTWYLVDYTSGTVPSPRIGACMGIDYSVIFIYGGMTYNGLSDELWYLDLGAKAYQLLDSQNSNGPGAIYMATCRFSTERTFKLYVDGGIGDNDVPSNGYYIYYKTTSEWEKLYHDTDDLTYARGNTKIFKINARYLMLGGEGVEDPDKTCYYFNTTTSNFYNIGTLPSNNFASAQEFFGSNIYIHGGGGSIGINLRRNIPVNTQMYADLSSACSPDETCYWKYCSPGTYLLNDSCAICPSGTYQPYYGRDCELCPEGTYYSGYGATSIDQCYPCDEGTYNPVEGASYCIDCPAGSYCPTGSSSFSYDYSVESDISMQPNLLKDRSSDVKEYSTATQIAIAVIGFSILIAVILILKRLNLFKKVDLYSNQHNHKLDAPMFLKTTKMGGLFSMIFVILALMIIASLLIDYSINNVLETKTLVPLIVMDEEVSRFVTDLAITVTILNYGATCLDDHGKCAETIGVTTEYLDGMWDELICLESGKDCLLTWECDECEIGTGAYIKFEFTNSSSYSAGWGVSISSNSSIPDSLSSYDTHIYPDTGKIFRGSSASVFNFDLTPSYYKNQDSGIDLTGYHVSMQGSQTAGSQYTTKEIPISYDLFLEIYLVKNSNSLITSRRSKQTLAQLISALLGSVFGLMGAIGGAMKIAEKRMKTIVEHQKSNEKTLHLFGNSENLEAGFDDIKKQKLNGKILDDLYSEDNRIIAHL